MQHPMNSQEQMAELDNFLAIYTNAELPDNVYDQARVVYPHYAFEAGPDTTFPAHYQKDVPFPLPPNVAFASTSQPTTQRSSSTSDVWSSETNSFGYPSAGPSPNTSVSPPVLMHTNGLPTNLDSPTTIQQMQQMPSPSSSTSAMDMAHMHSMQPMQFMQPMHSVHNSSSTHPQPGMTSIQPQATSSNSATGMTSNVNGNAPRTQLLQFITDEERWSATLSRSTAADSHFVYCVKSTHIYCRPSCPSRRPLRSNVTFRTYTDDAEADGYRPCKRCKPLAAEEPTQQRQSEAVDRARVAIENAVAAGGKAPKLDELATVAGLSAFHLHRLFKARVGFTPQVYGKRCAANP